MKILITGSNGLVGQKLVTSLKFRTGIDPFASSKGPNRNPNQKGYLYHEMDITDAPQIESVFSKIRPDTVIHTAALTNVNECELKQDDCWRINVDAVSSLISACEKHHTHLIHLSTDFVFDGHAGPYRETDSPNPVNFYGRSKLASEELLQKSKIQWSIVRTILVYGVTANSSRPNIVLWVLNNLLKNQQISVVNDQWRMPTLAEDVSAACVELARERLTGIYHISGNEMMSIYELAVRVAEYFKLPASLIKPVSTESLHEVAKRPRKTGFILEKATEDLMWRPLSFTEGLEAVKSQLK